MRYSLYSIESDEMLSIRALSRIKPSEYQFDPHYYAYGGGYLYPLGVWFFTLKKIGVINIGDVGWMMENPGEVEKIYRYGRIFVLIAFLISALIFYNLICTFQRSSIALLATTVYLFTPALIMFSIVMKPHAYTLVWCNLALLALFQSWKSKRISNKNIALVGVSTGIAVGSILTYSIFALFVWFGVLYLVIINKTKTNVLFIVPLISIVTFFIMNPYIILNFEAFVTEYSAQEDWFEWGDSLSVVVSLIKNSILLGLGISYIFLLIHTAIAFFKRSSSVWSRMNILAIWSTIVFIAFISASVSKWHVNSRYFFYLVPILLIVLIFYRKRNINTMLSILLAFNLLQSFPLVLAYHDEDNEKYSTRLKSAIWVNNNIDKNKIICTNGKSIAPYDTPPFDFKSYHIANKTSRCDVLIAIERQSDQVDNVVNSSLLARFKPRYTLEQMPFVFSHINPQISIYRLENEK
jgi:MFS family permease